MKSLVCELCGSNDITKKDGVYECSHCGTKYSVEEAKKLIVTVDNTKKISNCLEAARKARDISNWPSAAKHYDEVLAEDPDNWEAIFFSSYCTNCSCKIAEIASAALQMSKATEMALRQIKQTVPAEEQDAAVKTVAQYATDIGIMLYNGAVDHYNGIDPSIRGNYTGELKQRQTGVMILWHGCATWIDELFSGTQAHVQMLIPAKQALNITLSTDKVLLNKDQKDALLKAVGVHDAAFVEEYRVRADAKATKDSKKAMRGCGFMLGIPLILIGLFVILIFENMEVGMAMMAVGIFGMIFFLVGSALVKSNRPNDKK